MKDYLWIKLLGHPLQEIKIKIQTLKPWLNFSLEILSLLEPKTIDMFHFTGKKRTTPSCPINVVPNFNPKTGSQSYVGAGKSCSSSCSYRLPFFMDNLGPKYNAFSVAGHEGRPGHHTQVENISALDLQDFLLHDLVTVTNPLHIVLLRFIPKLYLQGGKWTQS